MAVKIFQPTEFREEIKTKLREGASPEELSTKYPVSKRTIYRYLKEVQDEAKGISTPPKKNAGAPAANIAAGVSKDAFTPSGAPTSPPPGSPPGTDYITMGTFRMPLEDWGYSNSLNLLIVAETFAQARAEYKLPPTMKVGDFIAVVCQAFRLMRGWDVIGAGYLAEKYIPQEVPQNGGQE
jgi:hypothetical protein